MVELIKDLGMRFPREQSTQKKRYGLYLCECGKEFEAPTQKIKSKAQVSCGCYKKSRLGVLGSTHKESKDELYSRWASMKNRCYCKKAASYLRYGGSGIKVCEEWKNNYILFSKWAKLNGYKLGLSLDRINPHGNYEPSNCRWIPKEAQAQNIKNKKSGTSIYKGVVMMKNGRFRAKISGKHIGCFESEELAALAYNKYVSDNNTYHSINIIKKEGLK